MAAVLSVQNSPSQNSQTFPLVEENGGQHYDHEWYINDENRYLFYEDKDNRCDDKVEKRLNDLQYQVNKLGEEIQCLQIELDNPSIDDITELSVDEEYADFHKGLLYDFQVKHSQLISENQILKQKVIKYEKYILCHLKSKLRKQCEQYYDESIVIFNNKSIESELYLPDNWC